MRPDSKRLAVLTLALTTAILQGHASAIPNPFKKKNKTVSSIPSGEQLRVAEMAAADLLAKARSDEAAGRDGAAMSGYRKIVTEYPYTSMAPAAQFRIAAALEKDDKFEKAFDAYQDLITGYRQTPQFSEALARQFGIAMQSRTEKTGRTLGFKSRLSPEDVVEMLRKVIASAPQGTHAAEAQFEIARIHEEEEQPDQAIAAYRKVVENYSHSPLAAEAQSKIGKTYMAKVTEGSRDQSNIVKAREATEEAIGLFPGGPDDMAGMEGAIDEAAAETAYTTGKFYQKKGNYRAAMIYFADVLKNPGSAHYEDVRDRVNEMTSRDPKLMDSVKGLSLDSRSLAVQAATDLKSKADYFGPPGPAPRVATQLRRPAMRNDYVPYAPLEPGDLPTTPGTPDSSLLDPKALPPPDSGVPAVPMEEGPVVPVPDPGADPASAPPALPPPASIPFEEKPDIPVEEKPAAEQ